MTEPVIEAIASGLESARERWAEEFPRIAFPSKSGEWWLLFDTDFQELQQGFPHLSAREVAEEICAAFAWLMANPSKAKTKKGMRRFLVNWISRARKGNR